MNNIKISFSMFMLLSLTIFCIPAQAQMNALKPEKRLLKTVDNSLGQCARQYRHLMQQLPADRFPVTYYIKNDKHITSGSEPWVGGFYPGALLYLFEHTCDSVLYREALKKLAILEKEKHNKTTHDLGFMMYCSFGNAKRIAPKPRYNGIIITSARSLATRYSDKVGCIRSWGQGDQPYMVIIDNMMNLELLFAATRMTGDSSFYKIAVDHANTTMQHHFRPDYSSHHLVIYDSKTGKVLKKQTVQGASDASAWARGQAWGLYGYTMTYRETRDKKYLDMANHIADFILNHPNLPKDKIPYWDFDAPGIPDAPRDVSAGTIICSALIELSGYVDKKTGKQYLKAAEDMLHSLTSPVYQSSVGDNGGFLLKHGVGNHPKNADIDVPLIYADYYFVESLHRYKKLEKK